MSCKSLQSANDCLTQSFFSRNTPSFTIIVPIVGNLYTKLIQTYVSSEDETTKQLYLTAIHTLDKYLDGDSVQPRLTPIMTASAFFEPMTHKLERLEKPVRKLIETT